MARHTMRFHCHRCGTVTEESIGVISNPPDASITVEDYGPTKPCEWPGESCTYYAHDVVNGEEIHYYFCHSCDMKFRREHGVPPPRYD